MPSSYSPNLRIELISTGEQAGTWGSTTNTNLGTLIEDAIAGYVSVSITSADQALTASNGAADQSRNMTIDLTTTTTANFNVYIPPAEKFYVIRNSSAYQATIYCSTVIGNTTAAGTGVAIPAGKETIIFSDATNVVSATDYLPSLSLGTALAVADGGTGASTAANARTNLNTVDDPGSNGILARTSANTTAARTITAGTGISITNGTGASGDPTITNDGVTSIVAGTGISISGPTGAVTISSSGAGSSDYIMNAYGTPATWTKPAGLKAIRVIVVGAGGNGGGGPNSGAAGGGGGGGASILYLDAPAVPGPVSITAGPGTNSFGGFASATAGSNGTIGALYVNAGGAGGIGVSGTVNIGGSAGGAGFAMFTPTPTLFNALSGAGGSSILGGGGASAVFNATPASTTLNGVAGNSFGGGGSGGLKQNAPPGPVSSGGAGASGIVIVEEFY